MIWARTGWGNHSIISDLLLKRIQDSMWDHHSMATTSQRRPPLKSDLLTVKTISRTPLLGNYTSQKRPAALKTNHLSKRPCKSEVYLSLHLSWRVTTSPRQPSPNSGHLISDRYLSYIWELSYGNHHGNLGNYLWVIMNLLKLKGHRNTEKLFVNNLYYIVFH
jgi:hypothetical protein